MAKYGFLFFSTLFFIHAGNTAPICSTLENANLKLVAHAMNLKNIKTTRTSAGGPFEKRVVRCKKGSCAIEARKEIRIQFDPSHPDSNLAGYVELPNIKRDDEWKGINSAISVIKKFAASGVCQTSLSKTENSAIVRYGSGSNIQNDIFNFNSKGEIVSWSRQYTNDKNQKINFLPEGH